jgi:ribonuclease J
LNPTLRIIPLGGFGEVGRNLTVIEYDGQMICIDCGLMFPEGDMPGIDIILPNFNYLKDNVDKLLGYFITHGHEDHIGALPFVLPNAPAPVYATRLARGLIEVKLKERKLLDDTEMHTIAPREVIEIGPFKVEPFRVSHSIPDTVGFAIDTPLGMLVHTAEFKFDLTPVDGQTTDIHRLAELGQNGVLALLSDSTNAERPGHTPSEAIVKEAMERVFERASGRIIISTFASNISRVQEVLNVAAEFDRKVAVVGRSMENNTKMALELGYLKVEPGTIVGLRDLEKYPDEEVAIVCTGTQGEPTSALVRMAHDNHRDVQLKKGDTVVLSASPIPGNEELVHRTLNELFKHGANVLYQALTPVHVSGHGNREELKLMLKLISPRYFVPNGGEHRMLVLHGQIAEELGMAPDDIYVLESGQILEFDGSGAEIIADTVPGEYIYVDGKGVGDIGASVLRDRRRLAEHGFLVCVVTVEDETGEVLHDPEIITRGFVYNADATELLEELSEHAANFIEERTMNKDGKTDTSKVRNAEGEIDHVMLAGALRQSLAALAYERTKRRPVVLPEVVVV